MYSAIGAIKRRGLVAWVESSSTRGGTPPYLGPCSAAKPGMDAVAVSYAGELARFGIETSIIVPGALPRCTSPFADAGHPTDGRTVKAYDELHPDLTEQIGERLAEILPADPDEADLACAVVDLVDAPRGERSFRIRVLPTGDRAQLVDALAGHPARRVPAANGKGVSDDEPSTTLVVDVHTAPIRLVIRAPQPPAPPGGWTWPPEAALIDTLATVK
jgi:hypothetical protein